MAETSTAAAAASSPSSSSTSDAVLQALVKRGWSFADPEHIKAITTVKCILLDDPEDTRSVAEAVESELLNLDLRSIGAKSLPDPAALRKSSHLFGPKVLQISSVRDISKSSIEDVPKNSSRRLLRLKLTDGHIEITAVEFTHIPSIPGDVVPGTKVRLENKVAVRSGIVCLGPRVLTVLGGVVQSLYEEWEMSRKYSAFSRESLQSQHTDDGGPPPFEKLQINASSSRVAQPGGFSQRSGSTSKNNRSGDWESADTLRNKSSGRWENREPRADAEGRTLRTASFTGKAEEKPNTSSDTRQKEVAESAPVQNQAAAQKLLQKMSQPSQERGRRGRGKGRQEEAQVFTLDEWEKRKAAVKPSMKEELPNRSVDEDLAWQLQNQFDLEDAHYVQGSPDETEAERIRRSMFSYGKENDNAQGLGGGRRGRGRGRRKRRGRF
ncbi:tudor domain-containing protein 3 [Punica granatum]|uniref:Tudor domain-containing protein 3 n=1 Tax=Punica granatum TaxID=22663 RepID=A0A6P8CDR1_PUNGR|nr:tudor domain-containing protein 3 [Punica granatum]